MSDPKVDRHVPPSETLIVDGVREGENYAALLYRMKRDGLSSVCRVCGGAVFCMCGGCGAFACLEHARGDDRRHGQPEGCIG